MTRKFFYILVLVSSFVLLCGCEHSKPLQERYANLHHLCASSDATVEDLREFLTFGADVNEIYHGETPLYWASGAGGGRNENIKIVSLLIEIGADVNAKKENGTTPLMIAAAYNNNPEIISILLKAGADAKAKDNRGRVALDFVISNQNRYRRLKGTQALSDLEEATNR